MKKSILLVVVLILLMSSIVSAGFLDFLTGKQVSQSTEREYTLNIGDEISINGKTLKLMNIGTDGTVFITVDDVEGFIEHGETKTVSSLKIRNTFASPPAVKSNVWHMEIGIPYSIPQQDSKGNLIPYDVTVTKILDKRSVDVDVNGVSEVIPIHSSETVNKLDITNSAEYISLIISRDVVVDDPIEGKRVVRTARQHLKIGEAYAIQDLDSKGNLIPYDVIVEQVLDNRGVKLRVNGISEIIPLGTTQTVNNLAITNDGKFVSLVIGKEFVDKTSSYATLLISVEGVVTSIKEPGISTVPIEITHVKEIFPEEVSPEGIVTPTEPVKIISTQVCNGCLVGDVCTPFGTRLKGQYCDISKNFLSQKELKESCENSYECRSNECSNSECISTAGLLQKLLDFLSKIFGR